MSRSDPSPLPYSHPRSSPDSRVGSPKPDRGPDSKRCTYPVLTLLLRGKVLIYPKSPTSLCHRTVETGSVVVVEKGTNLTPLPDHSRGPRGYRTDSRQSLNYTLNPLFEGPHPLSRVRVRVVPDVGDGSGVLHPDRRRLPSIWDLVDHRPPGVGFPLRRLLPFLRRH